MNPHTHKKNTTDSRNDISDAHVMEWLCGARLPELNTSPVRDTPPSRASLTPPNSAGQERQLSWRGARSEVVVGFMNHQGRSEIHRVTVYGLGPSGERLAEYETCSPPSPQVSDAIVRLLKLRPRNVNIDLYLSDIGGLIQSDKGNNFALKHPETLTCRYEIFPMQVVAPSFLEFSKAPAGLANHFVASWNDGAVWFEARGCIQPDGSAAELDIETSSMQGSTLSTRTYDITTQRASLETNKDRHNHLRTLIWEAIELCRAQGPDAIEYPIRPSEEETDPWDDDEIDSTIDAPFLAPHQRPLIGGQVVQMYESAGGATVTLEVVGNTAAISVLLPMKNLYTGAIFLFESAGGLSPLSASDIRRLEGLTADLVSDKRDIREHARQTIAENATSFQVCDQALKALYPSLDDSLNRPVIMAFHPHVQAETFLIDWVLEGYHPAIFTHNYRSPTSKGSAHNFYRMVLGVSQKGDIKLQLIHDRGERCHASIPAGPSEDFQIAHENALTILDMFRNHKRYTWDRLLAHIQTLTEEREGGRLRYARSSDDGILPPSKDAEGIIALALADSIVSACDATSEYMSMESSRLYAGQGEAVAFIRYWDTPACLGVHVNGDKITRLACYNIPAGQKPSPSSVPLLSVQPDFRSSDPKEILFKVSNFSESFAELLLSSRNSIRSAEGTEAETYREIFKKALTESGSRKPRKKRP